MKIDICGIVAQVSQQHDAVGFLREPAREAGVFRHAPRQGHDLARGLDGDDSSLAAQQVVGQRRRGGRQPLLDEPAQHAEEDHREEVVDERRVPVAEQIALQPVVDRDHVGLGERVQIHP